MLRKYGCIFTPANQYQKRVEKDVENQEAKMWDSIFRQQIQYWYASPILPLVHSNEHHSYQTTFVSNNIQHAFYSFSSHIFSERELATNMFLDDVQVV